MPIAIFSIKYRNKFMEMNQCFNIRNIIFKLLIVFFFAITYYSCVSDVKFENDTFEDGSISFIGSFDSPEAEIVVNKLIRYSVTEQEYFILRHNDTLLFTNVERTIFKVGERGRVLDTIVVDKGDQITVSIVEDSLSMNSTSNSLSSNRKWLTDFTISTDESIKKIFADLISYPDSAILLEYKTTPLRFTNNYEIIEIWERDPYKIDITMYNQNSEFYDTHVYENFNKIDSIIGASNLDSGSKEILTSYLVKATILLFRRLRNHKPWLYEYLRESIYENCQQSITVDAQEYIIEYLTFKDFKKIKYDDLVLTYQKLDSIDCIPAVKEIRKLALFRIFQKGKKMEQSKSLLEDYVAVYQDSMFGVFISEKFELDEVTKNGRHNKSLFIDRYDRDFTYNEVIELYKGKVVVVDFWASWCAPCRQNMPDLLKLEKNYNANGLEVVYASIDDFPNPWKRASMDENIWDSNTYWVNNWVGSDTHRKFDIRRIPRYIIYDRSGDVVYENAPKPAAMKDILEGLLENK